jgi:thiamine pyrophosphokinase
MTGLLVVAGEAPDRRALESFLREPCMVVAADSGLETALRLGLEVDLVVGDMDSISDPALLERVRPDGVLRYPVDKDETDAEIGLRVLGERGCDRVVVVGGGGGATDHFLGILMLFERPAPPAAWVTREAIMTRLAGRCACSVTPGETLSFFPLGREARVARSSGLRWPLDGLLLRRGHASLRNQAASGTIELAIGEGGLLMVRMIRETAGGSGQA